MARFLNPYNFVRPLEKSEYIEALENKFNNAPETLTHEEAEQLLMWRCPPPPHDRYTGLSGRITCKMTAQTPVFVSDGDGIQEDRNGHRTFRFFNVGGEDIIPASSLRGAIRSVFEAATNSTWSVFSDQQLSYRENSDVSPSLIPARLSYNPNKPETERWSAILLPGTSNVNFANGCRPNGKMYAAWVHFDKLKGYSHGQVCFAALTSGKNNNWVVQKLAPLQTTDGNSGAELLKREYPASNIHQGVLSITGDNFPNGANPKQHERFFFRTTTGGEFTVPSKVITRYNESLKQMREYHTESIKKHEQHLSRFLTGDWELESIHTSNPLLTGDTHRFPIYVHLRQNPKTAIYEIDYIAPIAVPRVPEEATLYEVLKREGFQHLIPSQNYSKLSLADRVFGWVSQDAKDGEFNQRVAYKGRIHISNATIKVKPKTLDRMSLSILSTPKPTTTRFYVNWRKNKNGKYVNAIKRAMGDERVEGVDRPVDADLRYGRVGNMLRGRKFYRHHGLFNRAEAEIHDNRSNSDQNRSIAGAHQEGTIYSFTITFENLQSVELGALLWSLELQDEFIYDDGQSIKFTGYHRIGYGKPLGFGSVKIEVEGVDLFDHQSRYTSIVENGKKSYQGDNCKKVIHLYSTQFKRALGALYGKAFERLINIVDICNLLSNPILNEGVTIHYPRPRHQRGMYRMSNGRTGDSNYEWFKNNKRPITSGGLNLVLVYTSSDIDGFPHMIWNNETQKVETIDE